MGAIAIPIALIGLAVLSVGILIQNQQNNNRNRRQSEIPSDSSTTSPSIWNEGLITTFPKEESKAVLCCGGEPEEPKTNWGLAFPNKGPAGASDTGGQEAVDTGPNEYNKEIDEGEDDDKENEPPKNKKARTAKPGEKVRTPESHPEDFKRGERGKWVNKHTGDIWDKSHTTHNDPEGEWKVGTKKGLPPIKTNKVTIGKDGTVIKIDK